MTDKITIDKAVVEQALEALDEADTFHRNLPDQRARRLAAMAALRAALEQPQQEHSEDSLDMVTEQPQPVAWMMVNPTHLPSSRSLHWEPQDWHITWQAVPLYTARAIKARIRSKT